MGRDPIAVEMDRDRVIELQCRFHDVYVRAVTSSGNPVPNIKFTFSISGKELSSSVTNETGYAYFRDIPSSNLTLTAYGGSNHSIKLGEWTVEVYEDEQVVDPFIGDNVAEVGILPAHLAAVVIVPA
ncbi:MAG: hypothetical protein ACUVQY_08685 [Thermoproteota archaeon]